MPVGYNKKAFFIMANEQGLWKLFMTSKVTHVVWSSQFSLSPPPGSCGISGSLALQEMRSLSGGQKSRVVLAELMTRCPHLLLLDEVSVLLLVLVIVCIFVVVSCYTSQLLLLSSAGGILSQCALVTGWQHFRSRPLQPHFSTRPVFTPTPSPPSPQPTNHLDLPSIEALKSALEGYGGGVILASHDQALIRDMLDSSDDDAINESAAGPARGELWEVKGRRLCRREGNIEDYLEELVVSAERREARRKAAAR